MALASCRESSALLRLGNIAIWGLGVAGVCRSPLHRLLVSTEDWEEPRTPPHTPLVSLSKTPSLPQGENISHQGRKEIEERDILEKLTIANC